MTAQHLPRDLVRPSRGCKELSQKEKLKFQQAAEDIMKKYQTFVFPLLR